MNNKIRKYDGIPIEFLTTRQLKHEISLFSPNEAKETTKDDLVKQLSDIINKNQVKEEKEISIIIEEKEYDNITTNNNIKENKTIISIDENDDDDEQDDDEQDEEEEEEEEDDDEEEQNLNLKKRKINDSGGGGEDEIQLVPEREYFKKINYIFESNRNIISIQKDLLKKQGECIDFLEDKVIEIEKLMIKQKKKIEFYKKKYGDTDKDEQEDVDLYIKWGISLRDGE